MKAKLKGLWVKLKRYDPCIRSYGRLIGGTFEIALSGFCALMELSYLPIVQVQVRITPAPMVTADPIGWMFYVWPLLSVMLTLTVWCGVMAHGLFMLAKSLSVFDYHERRTYELMELIEAANKRLSEKAGLKSKAKASP